MANLFLESPWPGLIVWTALYISDFAMTMTCARLYRSGVNEMIAFEGSIEITPFYQKDVDALRLISPRFILVTVLTWVFLYAMWLGSRSDGNFGLYEFVLGAQICVQLAIHMRHFRNYFLFRAMLKGEGPRGRMEYGRTTMLRLSAVELYSFCGLFAVLAAVMQNWFFVGGAFACAVTALKHRKLAKDHRKKAEALPQAASQSAVSVQ